MLANKNMESNPLSTLKIDYWYKIFPAIGTITLVLGLTVEIKDIENTLLQLISVGVIFIGIGEWINHPFQAQVGANYKITSYNRINTFAGNLWDFLGIGLIVYAFVIHGQ